MTVTAIADFTKRPTDEQACTYAKSLFADPLVWDVQPNAEYGNAVDVTINDASIGGDNFAVVTVWFDNGELYGEW